MRWKWRGGEQVKAGDMVQKELDESGMEGVFFLELEIVAQIMSEVEVYLMMRRENQCLLTSSGPATEYGQWLEEAKNFVAEYNKLLYVSLES